MFSASYFSFLLAPLPAVAVARLFRKPVVMNYRSGQAPDHLRRSAIARDTLRVGGPQRRAVHIPARRLCAVSASTPKSSRTSSTSIGLRFDARAAPPARCCRRETSSRSTTSRARCALFDSCRIATRTRRLTLVGAGSQDESLRALAQSLELSNVTFAGRVPPADIWRYYADADIYLQTPNIDNMPASVLEAFASGCAVVATSAGGVPAILTDGVHGLLVDCDDHEAAAARVLGSAGGSFARPSR